MTPDEAFIIDIPAKNCFTFYTFALLQKITPYCASNWNSSKLEQLGIEFETENFDRTTGTFLRCLRDRCAISSEADTLITDLDAMYIV
jgi:hypothetical protein